MDISRLVLSRLVPALTLAVFYSIALFYGTLFILRLLYRWARNPQDTFWRVAKREVPPTCLTDPALGNHVYIQLKHVKLHYVEAGDQSKPLLLFLHGFPECWYSWRHQIKEFKNDYWVVAVDMRGYGDSEKPSGSRYYKLKYLVDDVHNLIKGLGRDRCTLVGHGFGGLVAWYCLMVYPQAVENYVIMSTPHPLVFRKMLVSRFSQFRKSWYLFFFQLPYLPELYMKMRDLRRVEASFKTSKSPSPYTEQDMEAYKFTFGKPGALTPAINYFRANVFPDRSLLKRRAEHFKMPRGLLIFGENDDVIDIDGVEKTRRMVFNLTTEVVKGASRRVQQDDPQEVNRLLREFLKEGFEPEVTSDQ